MTPLLRALALAMGALLLGLAAFLLTGGQVVGAIIWGVFGAATLAGTLYERVRYKAILARPPGGAFEKTPERFVDPESGKPVTVYLDRQSGERRYVQE